MSQKAYIAEEMEEPTEKHKTAQKPKLSGGQLLVVALLGAGLGILGTLYAQDLIEVVTPVALTVLLTLFAGGVLIYLAITFYRDKIIRYLFGEDIHFDSALTDAQDMVKQTIIGTTEAIPGLDPSKKKQLQQAAPRMANYLIWSRFRSQGLRMMIGFMVAIGGLATTILLFNQNTLLERQNEKIDMQMSLEESNRRSAMIGQMANVLDKIDEELRDTFNTNNGTRKLSSQLIGRIAALSEGLKPYQYLKDDTLSLRLSPERGQLLLAVINSGLDTNTLDEIYKRTTFEKADLSGVTIEGAYLKEVNLRNANLENSTLRATSFKRANLEGINLSHSYLESMNFDSAQLQNSVCLELSQGSTYSNIVQLSDMFDEEFLSREDLTELYEPGYEVTTEALANAYVHRANNRIVQLENILSDISAGQIKYDIKNSFRNANLSKANFQDSNFGETDLWGAVLIKANFTGVNLKYTDLTNASLRASNLQQANLKGANLANIDLYQANLNRVQISASTNLKNALLDFATLSLDQGGVYSDSLIVAQLAQAKTLYNCKNLPREWRQLLLEVDSSLFSLNTEIALLRMSRQ